MLDERVDVLVIGTGLCGLAIAVTAARRGLQVRCVSNERPGASLANFGQLHSGAVYAPVLPAVARACWQHHDRWRALIEPAQVGDSYGLALFHAIDALDRYHDAWTRIGIDAVEVDPRTAGPFPPPAAAFRIPDRSVNLPALHARLLDLARASGVPPARRLDVTLRRDPTSTLVWPGQSTQRAHVVVLATGADTPLLLSRAGIRHTLGVRRIAWGRFIGVDAKSLTYWLDGDLLAISPDVAGIRIGLPAVEGRYDTTEAEHDRLRAALDRRGIRPGDGDLDLLWGTVCEPTNPHANPSSTVIDLRDPPPGWTPTANLVVALPGKWSTAWHCADQVVDAIV
ncbi:FAD-dependent oxidoreductase [Planosporangium flavigriseum]|uniref:FAD dependent oxidoreductase domain-containing protein n=1 Tax=Planosporangium flavigriseum TaxID=373681 RepID=A0A8J3LJE4_9ACTN|nr:FAD-dependent oxidoreductase [Planosporangium flavigriseum]NJC65141.1 FAD-dependent oxidoreductase [Planosporangium flavigriseum]GIG71758.1 hypothetical protein Pfl04_01620 [Planosporangium flavigriseum]